MSKRKLIRLTTIGLSIDKLLEGQLAYLNNFFKIIAVSAGDKELLNAVNRENIACKTIPFSRNINLINDIRCLYLLIIYFRTEKPLIIHANTPKASLLSMIAGYFTKVPIRIYTVTGLRYQSSKGFKRKMLLFFEKITCLLATSVIPEGKGVRNDLIKHKITKKQLNILANGNINGINTSYFSKTHFSRTKIQEKRKNLLISETDFVFLFVGRIVKDKGIVELVSAFIEFQKENTISKLLLVGPFEEDLDPLSEPIKKTIVQHPNIITTGYQEDVRIYFALSDALVFPSYREGFPNVVLQAGAMELPSIVTDINGCNEIIRNGYNGLLIPPKNTEVLLEKMKLLQADTQLYNQLKAKTRAEVVKKYQQQEVWDALLEEYRRLEANL